MRVIKESVIKKHSYENGDHSSYIELIERYHYDSEEKEYRKRKIYHYLNICKQRRKNRVYLFSEIYRRRIRCFA